MIETRDRGHGVVATSAVVSIYMNTSDRGLLTPSGRAV